MKKVCALMCAAAMGLAMTGCKEEEKPASSMGAVGSKAECTDKSSCCTEGAAKEGSMGAVSTEKSGCCKSKSTEGSMGAVSGTKSECTASKSSCSGAKQN